MNFKVIEYIKKYVMTKYPMYYEEDKFMEFISMINSDKRLNREIQNRSKDSTIEEILESHELDYILDEVIVKYAQIKYTKIWAGFDGLSNRIKNIILKKAKENSEIKIISDEILDRICREIALGIIKNDSSDDYTQYMSGVYDNTFVEDYGYYFEEYRNVLLDHVKNIINKRSQSLSFKVSDDTYISMVNFISDSLLKDFDYDAIISGSCDKSILKMFSFVRKKIVDEISNYVENYIHNELDVLDLMGVDVHGVVNEMLLATVGTGEISANKLLEGDLNSDIKKCAYRNKKDVPTEQDAVSHIYSIIALKEDNSLDDVDLIIMAQKIYQILYSDNIFVRDIVSKKYDNKIIELFEAEKRKKLSIKEENKPGKKKTGWLKKLLHKRILPLALVGTLVTAGGKIIYDGISYISSSINEVIDDINSIKPLKKVDEFDKYEYQLIFTKYNEAYNGMVLNIPEFYNKAVSYGNDTYNYLGFYRMYENVMDDKLAIMDSALSKLKSYSSKDETMVDFYNSISGCSCYLDFVCDRLEEMGVEQIKEEKYQKAIRVYKNAMSSINGDETPMDILCVSFPEQYNTVVEIMNMYNKYSKHCEVDFGNCLIEFNRKNGRSA